MQVQRAQAQGIIRCDNICHHIWSSDLKALSAFKRNTSSLKYEHTARRQIEISSDNNTPPGVMHTEKLSFPEMGCTAENLYKRV
jgi:hypothetical protein